MLDEYAGYLQSHFNEYVQAALFEADSLLETHHRISHIQPIVDLFSTLESTDGSSVLISLQEIYSASFLALLDELGIEVDASEVELSTLVSLTNATLSLEVYGDPETLRNIIRAGSDPTDVFCELVGEVGGESWDKYLSCVRGIDSLAYERLVAKIDKNCNVLSIDQRTPEFLSQMEVVRSRLRDYLGGRKDLVITQSLASGMSVALPIDAYVDASFDYLTRLPLPSLSEELAAFAMASKAATEDLHEAVVSTLDILLDSTAAIAEVTRRTKSLLGKHSVEV